VVLWLGDIYPHLMLGAGVIIDNKKERISLKIKANFLIHVIFWEKKKIGMHGFIFLNLKSWINIVNGREASSLENDRQYDRRSHGFAGNVRKISD